MAGAQVHKFPVVDSKSLRDWISSGREVAFIDVREEGQFGEGHPLLAVNAPYSRLELVIRNLVPRLATCVALIGDNGVAEKSARRLRDLGYSDVHVVADGTAGWEKAGYPLYKGVNVPSKAFAEVVEHAYHTPSITTDEFMELTKSKADFVLLDSRTEEEYARFHVPQAVLAPGSDVVRRFNDYVPSPKSLVVVTCGGRTRGIIGAQALINAGVPNKVVVLNGGIHAWVVSGFELKRNNPFPEFPALSSNADQAARQRSQAIAARFGIQTIDEKTLASWKSDQNRTTYLLDVRSGVEFKKSHLPGAVSTPGGQLVQAIDRWVGTRNARLVLVDDDSNVRAVITAHWLKQMGWDVSVLQTQNGSAGIAPPSAAKITEIERVDVSEASRRMARGAKAISVDPSADFRNSHPAGAIWANRAGLDRVPADGLGASELVGFSSD